MAFTNEYLTEKEKAQLVEVGNIAIVDRRMCLRDIATVDRSRNIYLLRFCYRYGLEPDRDKIDFVCFYGEISRKNMCEIRLKDLGYKKDENIKKLHKVEFIQYWELEEIMICPPSKVDISKVKDALEDMMTAYGILGDPERNESYQGKFKAIVKI